MKTLPLAALAALALLAGCASSNSKPYVHNPSLSEAPYLLFIQNVPKPEAAFPSTVPLTDPATPPTIWHNQTKQRPVAKDAICLADPP